MALLEVARLPNPDSNSEREEKGSAKLPHARSRNRTFGDFEIKALLGRGGMSEVYRAKVLRGAKAGQHVAIKRLIPELCTDSNCVKLFNSEAKLSVLLRHPHVINVFEEGVRDGTHFIVMELIDGRDLAHILRRCKEKQILLPIDFALFLAKTLLEALHYAHTVRMPNGMPLGLVHCDVSPSNLFISRTGEIKLGDFGVARGRLFKLDIPRYVAGKPFYVSPEVLDGEIVPSGDVWAAAVTLYELLTLEHPWEGHTPEDIYKRIRKHKHKRARELRPEIPLELDQLIEQALNRDLDTRLSTAEDFAEALKPHLDERVGTPLAIAAVVRGLFGSGTHE